MPSGNYIIHSSNLHWTLVCQAQLPSPLSLSQDLNLYHQEAKKGYTETNRDVMTKSRFIFF